MREDSDQRRLTFPDDVTLVLWIELDQVVVDAFCEDNSPLVRNISLLQDMNRGYVNDLPEPESYSNLIEEDVKQTQA